MNSRERVLATINHQEPDRIPFDLGGMAQSGIHKEGYVRLRQHLNLPFREIRVLNVNTQQARFDEDIQETLGIDTAMVYSDWASPEKSAIFEDGEYWAYLDEWGVKRKMPKEGGLYFDVVSSPFDLEDVKERFRDYRWPNPADPSRLKGLREEAQLAHQQGKFVVLMGFCPGIVEMYAWLRGFNRFYMDLGAEPDIAEMFLDKLSALKADYWRIALSALGEYIDAVNEADDMAGQNNLLFSPSTYRRVVKPFHARLFQTIKKVAPQVKIIFHSCGAIRKLIPDLIEIGIDILNPVQISAAGMNPLELKREFGQMISFWGGGIDAQNVLSGNSLSQIQRSVQENIQAFAPGGGFVFAPTHIIQASVPPENIMAMWKALQACSDFYHQKSG